MEHRRIQAALSEVQAVLDAEDRWLRPRDSKNRPGGILLLKEDVPCLVVPDLHGRADFLKAVLAWNTGEGSVQARLAEGKLQLVCLGDGMHSELRGRGRWLEAFKEFETQFTEASPHMDQEMGENLDTMVLVMELKGRFPGFFHFLKGNHENVTDETGRGNHPFAKFVLEGAMSKAWILQNLGQTVLDQWDRFERSLPLLARGRHFVVSHARPKTAYSFERLIGYREDPEVIEGLTWTRDPQAEPGAIGQMFASLLGGDPHESIWIAGHTPVARLFRQDLKEGLLLIHNPSRRAVCRLDKGVKFDPEEHIIELPDPGASI